MKTIFVHILLPIIAAIVINALIYSNDWNDTDDKNKQMAKYLPPGYVIAVVWIVILGLLGYAHYLVYPNIESRLIFLAIIYCLAYPFLTALRQDKSAAYNVLSFIIAFGVWIAVFNSNKRRAVIYIVPFVLWTLYVTIITLLAITQQV